MPESGLTNVNATMMFEAVGKHRVRGIRHSLKMLGNVKDLILEYAGTDRIYTLTQNVGQDASRIRVGDWPCRVCYAGADADFSGWVAMDYRHAKDLIHVNHVPMSLDEETARGRGQTRDLGAV